MEVLDGKVLLRLELYESLISELQYLKEDNKIKSFELGHLERELRDKMDLIKLLLEKLNITNNE